MNYYRPIPDIDLLTKGKTIPHYHREAYPVGQETRCKMLFAAVVLRAIKDATAQPWHRKTDTDARDRKDAIKWIFAPGRSKDRVFILKHVPLSIHRLRRKVKELDPETYKYAQRRWPR